MNLNMRKNNQYYTYGENAMSSERNQRASNKSQSIENVRIQNKSPKLSIPTLPLQPKTSLFNENENGNEIAASSNSYRIKMMNALANNIQKYEDSHRVQTSPDRPKKSHRNNENSGDNPSKSYQKLWRDSKDMREIMKNNNALMSSMVDQEALTINSYVHQHQLKKLRRLAAVKIIQKWYREYRKKKSHKKSTITKQGNRGQYSNRNQPNKSPVRPIIPQKMDSNHDSKPKTKRQQTFEYEEIETDKGSVAISSRDDAFNQKRMLEELQIQYQMTSQSNSQPDHIYYQTQSEYESKEKAPENQSFALLEKSLNSLRDTLREKVTSTRMSVGESTYFEDIKKGSKLWEKSLRGNTPLSYQSYMRGIIKIQREFRKYLKNKLKNTKAVRIPYIESKYKMSTPIKEIQEEIDHRSGNKSNRKYDDIESDIIIEKLICELRLANKTNLLLERENGESKQKIIEYEKESYILASNLTISERKTAEAIISERVKLKEMLGDYSVFIDKVLQEKIEIMQRCDNLIKKNRELEEKNSQKEDILHNIKEINQRLNESEQENNDIRKENQYLQAELRRYEEQSKKKIDYSDYQKLKEENNKLSIDYNMALEKSKALEERVNKFEEIMEINQILLQQLQGSQNQIKQAEERYLKAEKENRQYEKKLIEFQNEYRRLSAIQEDNRILEEELIRAKEDLLKVKLEYEDKIQKMRNNQSGDMNFEGDTLGKLRSPDDESNKILEELLAEEMLKTKQKLGLFGSIRKSEECQAYVSPFRQSQNGSYLETSEKVENLEDTSTNQKEDIKEFSFEARNSLEIIKGQEARHTVSRENSPTRTGASAESGPFETARGLSQRINEEDLKLKTEEDQNEEISKLIQNISKKLEIAKSNMDERSQFSNLLNENNSNLISMDPFMSNSISRDDIMLDDKSTNKSSDNQEDSRLKLGPRLSVEMKKGLKETLKKAEALFGRGEGF